MNIIIEATSDDRRLSTRSLFIEMLSDGNLISTGTAFLLRIPKGFYLITNRHNVTGRNNLTNELMPPFAPPTHIRITESINSSFTKWETRTESLYDDHGNFKWLEHPTLKEKADFVALPLLNHSGTVMFPYPLEHVEPIPATDAGYRASVVGFPFGIKAGEASAIWATGYIASDPKINYNGLPMFLIDCKSRPGQSGSPVIQFYPAGTLYSVSKKSTSGLTSAAVTLDKFKLIGIYSGRISEQSDLGMVWKMSAIRELMQSIS